MRYVLAIKREKKRSTPEDFLKMVCDAEGLEPIGSMKYGRVLIDTEPSKVDILRDKYGDTLITEPISRFYRS